GSDLTLPPPNIAFITGYNEALRVGNCCLTWQDLRNVPSSQYEVFEPLLQQPGEEIRLYQAHSKIHFYTWGDQQCCLPRGATTATLIDGYAAKLEPKEAKPATEQTTVQQAPVEKEPTWEYHRQLRLRPGDILLFEEVRGPNTGQEADADPTRRHAIRLTEVEKIVDELYHQPLLEITWAEEDALPFPLCLSTIGPAPACNLLENISVARGNIILVDHGRRTEEEDWEATRWVARAKQAIQICEKQGTPAVVKTVPAHFRPALQKGPLTFSQPLPADGAASSLLSQDPR
ncbi:MAG: putative baseplate assembly protein, partial [Chloroflexota bacterium]